MDDSGEANTFIVKTNSELLEGKNGTTFLGKNVLVDAGREGTQTGEHEIGHTLGMIHTSDSQSSTSFMREGGNYDGRAPNPYKSDIQSMVVFPANFKVNTANNGAKAGRGTLREVNTSSVIGDMSPDTFKYSSGFRTVYNRPRNNRGHLYKLHKGKIK